MVQPSSPRFFFRPTLPLQGLVYEHPAGRCRWLAVSGAEVAEVRSVLNNRPRLGFVTIPALDNATLEAC